MSDGAFPAAFPVARYRLHAEVTRPYVLPQYPGSALRGLFGHALRQMLCVTGKTDCATCPLYRTCDYAAIFETPPPLGTDRIYSDIPSPYVIEPIPSERETRLRVGDTLEFDIVLIGPALRRVGLIMSAWQRALARPIAGTKGSARLECATLHGITQIWYPDRGVKPHPQIVEPRPMPAGTNSVEIDFITPLNLRHGGRYLGPDDITARDLFRALLRRIADLQSLQLQQTNVIDVPALLNAASRIEALPIELKRAGWTRYSNRQQRSMPVAGVIGRWQLRGPIAPLWPALDLGQWLHIGKKTSFGLGQYRLLTPRGSTP